MLTLTESKPTYQLPKANNKSLKPIGLSLLFASSLLFYGVSVQPKKVQIDSQQSVKYQTQVDILADQYLELAKQKIKQPGNECFRLSVADCLENLKPERPKYLQNQQPNQQIKTELIWLMYQARIDAIEVAKQRR